MKLSFLTILNETRPDKFYLTAFNKSTVPVLGSIKTDSAGTMSPVLLKDLSTEARLELIQRIKRIVPAELTKYEPYFVSQVMQGNLKLNKIEDTMSIFVNPNDASQSVMYCEGLGLYVLVFFMGILSLLIGLSKIL